MSKAKKASKYRRDNSAYDALDLLKKGKDLDTDQIAAKLGWPKNVTVTKCRDLWNRGLITLIRPATLGRYGVRAIYSAKQTKG